MQIPSHDPAPKEKSQLDRTSDISDTSELTSSRDVMHTDADSHSIP